MTLSIRRAKRVAGLNRLVRLVRLVAIGYRHVKRPIYRAALI